MLKPIKAAVLIAGLIAYCLQLSVLAEGVGVIPPFFPSSWAYSADRDNIPMEIRLGEDIDVGVQHEFLTIFTLFPIPFRSDDKINSVEISPGLDHPVFSKQRLSDTRMRLSLDKTLKSATTIKKLVDESQPVMINYEKQPKTELGKYSDSASGNYLRIRTQNGFQGFVRSDFDRSAKMAAILSIVPGLGYYYADENNSALLSLTSRALILMPLFSAGVQLVPSNAALSAILYFAEAKNSFNLVTKKNEVATDLKTQGLKNESQLILRDLEAIKDKPRKYVKYPSIMFDVSLVAGARLFPFSSTDKNNLVTYTGFSVGCRDYFIDDYGGQPDMRKAHRRALYYDDFYAVGWKNVYSVGYDENGSQISWNAGAGKAYHTEWLDLLGGVNIGNYDNPASFYLESRLNLAPLTWVDGTYVEVHSPY